jgi:hypothetical protein
MPTLTATRFLISRVTLTLTLALALSVPARAQFRPASLAEIQEDVQASLRVTVRWNSSTGVYQVEHVAQELMGTPSLLHRAASVDAFGSYRASLSYESEGVRKTYWGSLGIGPFYTRLNSSLTFRFPLPESLPSTALFTLDSEHPTTGKMERRLNSPLDLTSLAPISESAPLPLVRRFADDNSAANTPRVRVLFFSEGFVPARENAFWEAAQRATNVLRRSFPGHERMDFWAAFEASPRPFPSAAFLGFPIPDTGTNLQLYYPYWQREFNRWANIVYPTRETHFQDHVSSIPHDYLIVLGDSAGYWGMGNFNTFTVIPAFAAGFDYLLEHEFGHFFGLNEEYDQGGTELLFAPKMTEPWSPNITFQSRRELLKWAPLIAPQVPVPTPRGFFAPLTVGLYAGGYGLPPGSRVFKPAIDCRMDAGHSFCPVCHHAISKRLARDLGIPR